jgi:hypothetical protein
VRGGRPDHCGGFCSVFCSTRRNGAHREIVQVPEILVFRTSTLSGERVRVPLEAPTPLSPRNRRNRATPLPGAETAGITGWGSGCRVALLQGGRARLDTLDGQDSGLGKFSIEDL